MPSAKSARVSERRRIHNAPIRSKAKTFVTKARRSLAANDLEAAEQTSCVSEELEDVSIISLTVYINGIDQLYLLFSKLEGINGVIGVSRART